MCLVSKEDYLEFIKYNDIVTIGKAKIKLGEKRLVKLEPEDYNGECSTVWSFPDRGYWSTHKGDYRGNWSPYIPRNLITRYTKQGDLVLDQMMGSGTTLVECKLLGRNAIGVDINYNAVMVAQDRLNFDYKLEPRIETYHGDARKLDKIEDNSIDLIATHPPYAGIIAYSNKENKADLSSLSIKEYLTQMYNVARECYRVLKPGKHCAILIGDTRKHKHYIPITHNVMHIFLESGFILREYIIKIQHKTKATREVWRGSYDFYKIAHEHLLVFRKPDNDEKVRQFIYSMDLL
ncbi:MAG: methyltransferase domain-containing protein [Candidatus Nitrosothermus koennekii]|nr:MAG: methyltransferase domain-containing protein [Candidatus Nitrosothermus koennekii]